MGSIQCTWESGVRCPKARHRRVVQVSGVNVPDRIECAEGTNLAPRLECGSAIGDARMDRLEPITSPIYGEIALGSGIRGTYTGRAYGRTVATHSRMRVSSAFGADPGKVGLGASLKPFLEIRQFGFSVTRSLFSCDAAVTLLEAARAFLLVPARSSC